LVRKGYTKTVERTSQLRHGRCESWAFALALLRWSQATIKFEVEMEHGFFVDFAVKSCPLQYLLSLEKHSFRIARSMSFPNKSSLLEHLSCCEIISLPRFGG